MEVRQYIVSTQEDQTAYKTQDISHGGLGQRLWLDQHNRRSKRQTI